MTGYKKVSQPFIPLRFHKTQRMSKIVRVPNVKIHSAVLTSSGAHDGRYRSILSSPSMLLKSGMGLLKLRILARSSLFTDDRNISSTFRRVSRVWFITDWFISVAISGTWKTNYFVRNRDETFRQNKYNRKFIFLKLSSVFFNQISRIV